MREKCKRFSPFRLLRWVPFETISDLVAEAKTQFAILLDEWFGAAWRSTSPTLRIPDISGTLSSWPTSGLLNIASPSHLKANIAPHARVRWRRACAGSYQYQPAFVFAGQTLFAIFLYPKENQSQVIWRVVTVQLALASHWRNPAFSSAASAPQRYSVKLSNSRCTCG
jgi:hypothetical protein